MAGKGLKKFSENGLFLSSKSTRHAHNTHGVVAAERGEIVDPGNGRGVSNPLNGLPVCDQPNFGHFVDGVQESDEAFLVMGLREPSGMVEQTKRSPGKIRDNVELYFRAKYKQHHRKAATMNTTRNS